MIDDSALSDNPMVSSKFISFTKLRGKLVVFDWGWKPDVEIVVYPGSLAPRNYLS